MAEKHWREVGTDFRASQHITQGDCPQCGVSTLQFVTHASENGRQVTIHTCHVCRYEWYTLGAQAGEEGGR